MFSVVVAGRLPLPAPQQIDETHAIFALDDATSINHVVVFMTGQQAFPPGYAATVHLHWRSGAEDKWRLLGCLKNEKPSAIYRIKGLTQQDNPELGSTISSTAIGLSIEPVVSVDEQMASLSSRLSSRSSGAGMDDGMQTEGGGGDVSTGSNNSLVLARPGQLAGDPAAQTALALAMAPRIASNIFSFLSSFAPDSAPQTVPLLKRWLEQFERKLRAQGIAFLARAEAE